MTAETGHREVAESLHPNHVVVARPFVDEKQAMRSMTNVSRMRATSRSLRRSRSRSLFKSRAKPTRARR
jgi:hypothetical protein